MNLFSLLNSHLFRNRIKIIYRDESWIKYFTPRMNMSLFNYVMLVNKNQGDATILHELQHTIDRCVIENGYLKISFIKSLKFYLLYLVPQLLATLSLFSFYNLYFLLFLLFLIPNPYLSYFRREYEKRAYFWNYIFNNDIPDFSKIFGGLSYWKMDTTHSNDYYINEFKLFRRNVLSGVEYKSNLMYKKYVNYFYAKH